MAAIQAIKITPALNHSRHGNKPEAGGVRIANIGIQKKFAPNFRS
jgi:hypothetical protein